MSADPTFADGAVRARLESACGRVIYLPVARWWAAPPSEESPVLSLALPPVLDVGCGPGRHVIALQREG